MNLTPDQIIKRPIALTEKATRLKADEQQYVFEVAMSANKIQIRAAVEAMWPDVKVTTLVQHGKVKRVGRGYSKRPNWKKAIVTLDAESDIQIFEEADEE